MHQLTVLRFSALVRSKNIQVHIFAMAQQDGPTVTVEHMHVIGDSTQLSYFDDCSVLFREEPKLARA